MDLDKAIAEYGNSMQKFAMELYNFLKHSSLRRGTLSDVQFELDIREPIFRGLYQHGGSLREVF